MDFIWRISGLLGPLLASLCRDRQRADFGSANDPWVSPKYWEVTAMAGTCTIARVLGFASVVLAALAQPSLGEGSNDMPRREDWWKDVKFSGHVEAGNTFNSTGPANGLNFGHLFTDRSDMPLLNQFLLTLEKPIDSKKASEFQLGFKLQGMYGTDARYTHFLGEFDRVTHQREQFDVVEAFFNIHLPILTKDGVDVKIGQYVTLEGVEVIYAPGNFFYSHSYIFNFGTPYKHTGIMTTTHVNPMLDLYLGIDTGLSTTFGHQGDTNDAIAFHGGIGLNFLQGNLTVLATTHIGPELPRSAAVTLGVEPNRDLRYLNDITVVWKATKALTLMTDLNHIRDDGLKASGWGVAQYATYTVNDRLSLGVRGELWRDNDGAFVAAFPGNLDFINAQMGFPNTAIAGPKATYGAITVGANIKPPVEKRFEGFVMRPEVRYDWSSNGMPFDAGTKDHQLTIGMDLIVPFSR
jgi:hypothetical protein